MGFVHPFLKCKKFARKQVDIGQGHIEQAAVAAIVCDAIVCDEIVCDEIVCDEIVCDEILQAEIEQDRVDQAEIGQAGVGQAGIELSGVAQDGVALRQHWIVFDCLGEVEDGGVEPTLTLFGGFVSWWNARKAKLFQIKENGRQG